ncbi:MAG: 16S rRNA (guanine(966)-N(2))-methyltransferase RsmD [Candidatus Eisenbacteria bacterium]|nr:16S rRNA (guanine(966)-N(2))-methyltransferase RsmD [Candidatus Eisenbacteria bacterium]
MRIVGGRWRGRALRTPPGREHRPTLQMVREALFDTLGERTAGARVVDLYAGSGALGLEALSRGALHASFVERSRAALDALRANIALLGASECARVIAADALEFLARGRERERGCEVDILFADPPYGTVDDRWMARVTGAEALCWSPSALFVLETSRREPELAPAAGWRRWRARVYGETRIVIDAWGTHDGERAEGTPGSLSGNL